MVFAGAVTYLATSARQRHPDVEDVPSNDTGADAPEAEKASV